jgi:uncharacterized protein YecE (DUF72 family)
MSPTNTAAAQIHLGTSAFTAAGWKGSFYPQRLKPAEYLTHYAQHFGTVEIDSTFYGAPKASAVRDWYAKTPRDFLFAAKVPREITHRKVLHDCDAECKQFLGAMELLGEKLGPLLFQFGYFGRSSFATVDRFLAILVPFLDKLPKGHKFAVEIRNKHWLVPKLASVLRDRGIALTLTDQSWMLRPAEWFERFDPITADFTYVRWLGDRKGIEQQTRTWNKTIVDRRTELSEWAKMCYQTVRRGVSVFAYANNHFAGHAPATIAQFLELWPTEDRPERKAPLARPTTGVLFPL